MGHSKIKDPAASVVQVFALAEDGGTHDVHTIELDCPPGMIRPWQLIKGVVKGTELENLVSDEPGHTFFGMRVWEFPTVDCDHWIALKPILSKRITALYNSGTIRFGSW